MLSIALLDNKQLKKIFFIVNSALEIVNNKMCNYRNCLDSITYQYLSLNKTNNKIIILCTVTVLWTNSQYCIRNLYRFFLSFFNF